MYKNKGETQTYRKMSAESRKNFVINYLVNQLKLFIAEFCNEVDRSLSFELSCKNDSVIITFLGEDPLAAAAAAAAAGERDNGYRPGFYEDYSGFGRENGVSTPTEMSLGGASVTPSTTNQGFREDPRRTGAPGQSQASKGPSGQMEEMIFGQPMRFQDEADDENPPPPPPPGLEAGRMDKRSWQQYQKLLQETRPWSDKEDPSPKNNNESKGDKAQKGEGAIAEEKKRSAPTVTSTATSAAKSTATSTAKSTASSAAAAILAAAKNKADSSAVANLLNELGLDDLKRKKPKADPKTDAKADVRASPRTEPKSDTSDFKDSVSDKAKPLSREEETPSPPDEKKVRFNNKEDKGGFVCSKCGQFFNRFRNYYLHQVKRHDKKHKDEALDGIPDKKFKCPDCLTSSDCKREIDKHRRKYHYDLYKCTQCTFSTYTRTKLNEHCQIYH